MANPFGAIATAVGMADTLGINPIANYNADRDFSKSVDAQRGLTQLSYDLSQRNWESQFDKESRYNTPYNEAFRQREAGFNPYVRESAANGIMSMPAQTGSGTAASVNPVPNYVDRYSSAFLDSLRGINQGIVNEKTKDMINAQIQDLIAGAASKDAQAQFTSIQADLERRYGSLLKRRQINKLNADIQEAFANATKLTEEGRYFDQGIFESLAKEAMNKALGGKYQKEAELFDLDIRNYADKLKHLFKLQDAQSAEHSAAAGELGARESLVREQADTQSMINKIKRELLNDEKWATLEKLRADKKLSEREYQYAQYKMSKVLDLLKAREHDKGYRVLDDIYHPKPYS